MDTENQSRLTALCGKLRGEKEHDRAVLLQWAERYRGDAAAGPLLREIGRRLYELDAGETEPLTQQVIDDALRAQDDALADARRLCRLGKTEAALRRLEPFVRDAVAFAPSDGSLWMDFHSFLDGLLFQDYFADEIGGREILRHPLRPGELLYAYACLLVECGRLDEALDTLQQLNGLDPVCPKYLFELGDVYKRVGELQEAFSTALWALECVSTDLDAARCCRDLGYCLAEAGEFENAAVLYQLSIRFQPSPQAEAELRWIAGQSGVPIVRYGEDELLRRCDALGVATGLSETVKKNLKLLETLFPNADGQR